MYLRCCKSYITTDYSIKKCREKLRQRKKAVCNNQNAEKTYRRAASLAASRTSGFSALFFWITSKVAPTMDLE
jgi:hypothetical protein